MGLPGCVKSSFTPRFQRFWRELRTVIDSDRFRGSMRGNPSIEEVGHVASPKPKAWLYDHGFTTPLSDHRQNAERTCIEQLIVHEIHTQPLVWVCRLRNHAAMETPVHTSSEREWLGEPF